MKKKSIPIYYSFFLYIALLLTGVYGCDNELSEHPAEEETPITLQLHTGGLTRADNGNADREMRIDQLAVLVFKQTGDQKEVFSYRAKLLSGPTLNNDSRYELSVSLRKSFANEKYTLVLIANHDLPNQMGYLEGVEKSVALATMTYPAQAENASYIWYNSDNKPFPMWGEAKPQEITDNTKFETIYLLRALAKIDVGFDTDKDGTFDGLSKDNSPYTLGSVYVYRSQNGGAVAPVWARVSNPYTEQLKVTVPTLPTTLVLNPPIRFDASSAQSGTNKLIYLPESPAGTVKDTQTTTSLVLGIRHDSFTNATEGATSKTRYFRADIANKGETETLPILRNHHYIVGIQELTGEGHETPDNADKGGGLDGVITVNVMDWIPKESDFDIVGEQFFNISGRHAYLPYEKDSEHVFTFTTNLKEDQIELGIDKATQKDLEIALDYAGRTLTVKTKTNNTTGGQIKKYTFHIQAGWMKIQMVVEQSSK